MKRMKWAFGFASILATALVLTCGRGATIVVRAADKTANIAIKIDNFSFEPGTISISAGTTVTWTNNDDVPHVVASDESVFKSKALDTDDRFSYTFTKPGTYKYYCAIHPKMTAKIVVQ